MNEVQSGGPDDVFGKNWDHSEILSSFQQCFQRMILKNAVSDVEWFLDGILEWMIRTEDKMKQRCFRKIRQTEICSLERQSFDWIWALQNLNLILICFMVSMKHKGVGILCCDR